MSLNPKAPEWHPSFFHKVHQQPLYAYHPSPATYHPIPGIHFAMGFYPILPWYDYNYFPLPPPYQVRNPGGEGYQGDGGVWMAQGQRDLGMGGVDASGRWGVNGVKMGRKTRGGNGGKKAKKGGRWAKGESNGVEKKGAEEKSVEEGGKSVTRSKQQMSSHGSSSTRSLLLKDLNIPMPYR